MDAFTSILTTGTVTPATLATGTIVTGTLAPSYTVATWEPPSVYDFSDWKVVDTPQGRQLRFRLRGRNYAVSCEELLNNGNLSGCTFMSCTNETADKEDRRDAYDTNAYDTTEIDSFLDEFTMMNKKREE